jgi:hypothetical protein
MFENEPKIITNPKEIKEKIKEVERRSREWDNFQMRDWPTMDEDMGTCIRIMMSAFVEAGGPVPAFEEREGELMSAAWVKKIEDHCRRIYGERTGLRISAEVVSRLAAVAENMAAK